MADLSAGTPCWDCGETNDALAAICWACGADLYEVPPVPTVPPVEAPGAAAAPLGPPAATAAPRGRGDPGTPGHGPAAHPSGAPLRPVLVLPDGARVPIPHGRLEVGRECGTPAIEDALAPYVDVSRRHAVIARDGDQLLLTEIKDGSFGTEVDGRRLAPFVPVDIRVGARIKLGTHCYVTVEAGDD